MIPEVFCHKPQAELVEDGSEVYAEVFWTGGGGKKKSVKVYFSAGMNPHKAFSAMSDGIETHIAHHDYLQNAANVFLADKSFVAAQGLLDSFDDLNASDEALAPADIRDPEMHRQPLVVKMAQESI